MKKNKLQKQFLTILILKHKINKKNKKIVIHGCNERGSTIISPVTF
jgi:hypothetical protein